MVMTVLVAGLVAGSVGLGSALIGTRLARHQPIAPAAATDDAPDPASEVSAAAARTAGRALVQAAVAAAQNRQPSQGSAAQRPMLTPEEEGARRRLQHENLIDQHRAEAVSPTWAAEAQGAVVAELKSLQAETKFSLLGVDCRSTSCLAEVEWPSINDIRRGYHSLLHARFDNLNCATEFYAPTTAAAGTPLRTTLVLSKCRSD